MNKLAEYIGLIKKYFTRTFMRPNRKPNKLEFVYNDLWYCFVTTRYGIKWLVREFYLDKTYNHLGFNISEGYVSYTGQRIKFRFATDGKQYTFDDMNEPLSVKFVPNLEITPRCLQEFITADLECRAMQSLAGAYDYIPRYIKEIG